MWPYLLIAGALGCLAASGGSRVDPRAWTAAFVLMSGFIGLRHHVGMDWNNYLHISRGMERLLLEDALRLPEPAYGILLWTSVRLGWGVYGANVVGALVYCYGLFRCAAATRRPWVALAVAFPMLSVVVGMSASRQSIAIGLSLLLVSNWHQSGVLRRLILIVSAAGFHNSALAFLPLLVLDSNLSAPRRILVGAVVSIGFAVAMVYSGAFTRYDSAYGSGQTEATYAAGALQHSLLNGVPALALLAPARLRDRALPSHLHRVLAVIGLGLVPLALFNSLASSRMTLYLFPVSMTVFAAVDTTGSRRLGPLLRGTVGLGFAGVLWYWLLFSNSGYAYVPYRSAVLIPSHQLEF